jgi:hypothetical protein
MDFSILASYPAKTWVRDVVPNKMAENVVICCMVSIIAHLGGEGRGGEEYMPWCVDV